MNIILQKSKVEGQKKEEEFFSKDEKLLRTKDKQINKVQLNKKNKINFNNIINKCKIIKILKNF